MSKEIAIKESYNVEKIKDAISLSEVLRSHVVKHKLFSPIKGKNYVQVEGWAFAGGLLGLHPKVAKVECLSSGTEIKWKADVELIQGSTEKVVANGFAICSSKEATKKGFDEYAILSMAQTRAIGKAYRNKIGWIMKLSGYEGTPAEEMVKAGEKMNEPVITYDDTTKGPDDEPVLVCKKCDEIVDPTVANFSKKIYGKILCRACQKEAKRK